jgi:hypothetical protein
MKNGHATRLRRQVTRLEARQGKEAITLYLTTEELSAARAALRHAVRRLERPR